MDFSNLDKNNVLAYAQACYCNPNASEFADDYSKVRYVIRLLKRSYTEKDIQEHLILNHLIMLSNVFGPECAVRLLFARLDPDLWSLLKTFLVFMGIMPDVVPGICGRDVLSPEILINLPLATTLKTIKTAWF
jgi:hypothetical protein